MPLKKLQLRSGVNLETTRYTQKVDIIRAIKYDFAKARRKKSVGGSVFLPTHLLAFAGHCGLGLRSLA
jgi:hypothetical protein